MATTACKDGTDQFIPVAGRRRKSHASQQQKESHPLHMQYSSVKVSHYETSSTSLLLWCCELYTTTRSYSHLRSMSSSKTSGAGGSLLQTRAPPHQRLGRSRSPWCRAPPHPTAVSPHQSMRSSPSCPTYGSTGTLAASPSPHRALGIYPSVLVDGRW